MSTPAGWPSQQKYINVTKLKDGAGNEYDVSQSMFAKKQHQTVQSVGSSKFAADTVMNALGLVATDAVEANSTTRIIKATAHSAREGDHVRMVGGANDGLELQVISVPDVDTIILAADLLVAPSALDVFQIHRGVTLKVNPSTGGLEVTSVPLNLVDLIDDQDNGDGVLVPLLDASSTNIPARGATPPVEIVASLAARTRKLQIFCDFGFRLGLYTGASGSEVLLCVLPLTPDFTVEVDIAAGTRLSVKSLETTLINTGALAINFLG